MELHAIGRKSDLSISDIMQKIIVDKNTGAFFKLVDLKNTSLLASTEFETLSQRKTVHSLSLKSGLDSPTQKISFKIDKEESNRIYFSIDTNIKLRALIPLNTK